MSLERKWNGQFQILFNAKFRSEPTGATKHLASCLQKENKVEALKILSIDHQELTKTFHCTSEGKYICAAEKMDQDAIDEKPFSWLKIPNDFSVSSNNR